MAPDHCLWHLTTVYTWPLFTAPDPCLRHLTTVYTWPLFTAPDHCLRHLTTVYGTWPLFTLDHCLHLTTVYTWPLFTPPDHCLRHLTTVYGTWPLFTPPDHCLRLPANTCTWLFVCTTRLTADNQSENAGQFLTIVHLVTISFISQNNWYITANVLLPVWLFVNIEIMFLVCCHCSTVSQI